MKQNPFARKLLARCLLGALIGLSISSIITILISLTHGSGTYYPVAPALIAVCGSELNAVLLQAALSLVYGAGWGGAALVWEQERWSLLRQTLTHLAVCSLTALPIAYFCYWMPHSPSGILLYFAIFFGIYLIIWLAQYAALRRRVRQINARLPK